MDSAVVMNGYRPPGKTKIFTPNTLSYLASMSATMQYMF